MLATYVIGLREGLEAALIVGIVAAFLRQRGQARALRYVWVGVVIAVLLCSAVGVALQILGQELPQRQQEMLETVVGVCAVGIVTFMVVWMRRHAPGMRAELEANAAAALAQGSVFALVGMAFFAVLREGLETAVFLLAAFQAADSELSAGLGALLGILTAVVVGAGLYRGGIRINLTRFFRVTSVVLVIVAGGLLATAVHTAHEAAWFNNFQGQALDLSWLVVPGTVTSSLLTGMLGLQPLPTYAEAGVWLIYVVPMLLYVLWPQGRRLTAAAVACVLAALSITACGSSSSAPKGAHKLAVTLVDSGCTPESARVPAGSVTFEVTNAGTSKVSEMELKNRSGIILGESENVVEGVPGHFSLNLQPGTYIINCPNGDKEDQGKLVATGNAVAKPTGASAALLSTATSAYRAYVIAQTAQLQGATKRFVAALRAGDVREAKALFGPTRLHYESIEPVAESFGDLDPDIDARINDVTNVAQWTGFHRIERTLWEQNTTRGTASYATKLMDDVNTLARKVQAIQLQPAQLANGAVELMNEVANSKITGEEDRYSHTDLSDFQGNLSGSEKAFNLLVPALRQTGNAALAATISARFAAVQKSLDRYKRDTSLGYAPYTQLTLADRKTFAAEVDALDEPLSTVAAKVSSA